MDSLKTLMDKREYELVIQLTNNATDSTSLFYRISAFLASGKANDALAVIENNRAILESSPAVLIKIHIEILCLLNKFDEAYEKYNYYCSLPYVSQTVEELLKAIPNYIRCEEKKANSVKQYDDEMIIKNLLSNKEEDVLMSLDIIKEKDLSNFILPLQKVMINFPKQTIRALALMMLVRKEYSKEVKINLHGNIVSYVPSKVEPPFVGEPFNSITKKIQMTFKDPVIGDNAISILSTYIIYNFPEKYSFDENTMLGALFIISSEYLGNKVDHQEVAAKYQIDIETLEKAIKDINKALL